MGELLERKKMIVLEDNNLLKISGIKNVVNISENDVVVLLDGESLHIKGENIKAEKLSVENGELILLGKFISLKFINEKTKQSLLKRIFK